MKRGIFVLSFLFFAIAFLQGAYAITSDMEEIYRPGETLIGEIIGNILEPIAREDVELRRGHVQVPFEYDFKRVGQNYFLIANLPTSENNYTIIIKNIKTTVDGQVQEIDFMHNLSTSGNITEYYLTPEIIFAEDDFSIEVFSNLDSQFLIGTDFPEEREVEILPGENEIYFDIEVIESGFRRIALGMYSIPVMVIGEQNGSGGETEIPRIRFFPKTIESIILYGESAVYPVRIINDGDLEIRDMRIEYDSERFSASPDYFETILPNESAEFNLTVKEGNDSFNEVISARSGEFVFEMSVNLNYTENSSEVKTPYTGSNYTGGQGYYCSELGGRICSAGEECSGSTVSSLDSPSCCTTVCAPPEEDNYAWVGYLIGTLMALILIGIMMRYFKTKKKSKMVKPLLKGGSKV